MSDDRGRSLRFTALHQGNTYQYRCTLNDPVQPGDVELFSNTATETGLVRNLGGGAYLYTMTHSPNSRFPTRRIELFRLPLDATLIYASPNLTSRVVDGRRQLFMDLTIPPGGSNTLSFRYRLAP